jgi:AraC-like DNA-binding protein
VSDISKPIPEVDEIHQDLAISAPPALFSWGARALYIGPALGLSAHRNAVAVLAVGLDAQFALSTAPADPEAPLRPCRSALIPPSTLHRLVSTGGRMAFLYVDAASRDLERIAAQVQEPTEQAGFNLTCEARLIELFDHLHARRITLTRAREELGTEVLSALDRELPTALARTIEYLNKHARERPSLGVLASMAKLSESRFRHLFVAATGTTLRRYRSWAAMGVALRWMAKGASLTDAACEGAFSSSAHFSAAFREMFGMEPSRLARLGMTRAALPGGPTSV